MKKIHRFLIESVPSAPEFELSDERSVHQITEVLKIAAGEQVILFSDGSDDVVCTILSRTKKSLFMKKDGDIPAKPSPRKIITAVSIPKGDTFELIVQKLTELGVQEIIPIISTRTVKPTVRLDRLQKISDEALEQCGGNIRVTIHEPLLLKDCLEQFAVASVVFQPNTEPLSTQKFEVVYIGPEGGWSTEDIELFKSKEITFASLGDRILRTETAAIVAAYELLKQ